MIDFGNLLDEFYQESSKEKKSDKKKKYDDKYDLDNGPDTEIEPVDVDVDDDFDNDTTDKEDEDKKDDKDDDKKKGDKKEKSSNVLDKMDSDGKVSPEDDHSEGEIDDIEEFSIQESYTMEDISKYGAKKYCDMHYDPSQHDEIIKRTIAGCEAFFKKYFGFDVTDIESKLKGLKFKSNNGEEYKISDTYDPEKIIGVLSAIAIHHMWKESEIEDAKGFNEESIINSIECEDLDVIIGKAKRNMIPYHLFINWKGGEDDNLYIYISKNPAEPSSHCDDINVKDLLKSKDNDEEESYQEASVIKKRHESQDVDTESESRRNENDYYTKIARNSKDLEHLYKTLLKRADKETVIGELMNLFNELKIMREKYFENRTDIENSKDAHQSYHGMQKIIDQDMELIQKNLDKMQDPKEPKLSKTLVKKTIKMMNNLQQDMITECERSQPFVVRHLRDIGKKMWLFESYTEDDFDESEIVQEEKTKVINDPNKKHRDAVKTFYRDMHNIYQNAISPLVTGIHSKYQLSKSDIEKIRKSVQDMEDCFESFMKDSLGTDHPWKVAINRHKLAIKTAKINIDEYLDKASKEGYLAHHDCKKLIKNLKDIQKCYIGLMESNRPIAERAIGAAADLSLLLHSDIQEIDDGDTVVQESLDDEMFAKIGEMLVHYRKQKELQDLAEKNGVQINGVRYTDDSIMNIVTSVVALMMARNEGDPRYHQLVEQGMRKRSLKVEIINSYKDRANEMINQYDHGPIVGATPVGNTIEIVSDENVPVEEFYIDENGEMQSTYYQEADDDSDEKEEDEEIDDDDDVDEEDDLDESDSEEKDAKDDDDEETDDDDIEEDDEDEDIEEFYIDENGEMQSTWYQEENEENGANVMRRQHIQEDEDDLKSWTFKPGKKIGRIEFGMGKKHAHAILNHRYGEPNQANAKEYASAETYGNKFTVYYDSNDKVESVEVMNGLVINLDRSIIFPGDPSNIKKKALDLNPDKNNPERGMVSKIMAISVIVDSSNKIKSITFSRKDFYRDKEFKKFDQVKDMLNGEGDEIEAIRKMKEIYKFLDKHHLLTQQGKTAMKHITSDTVLTTNEIIERGCAFMVKYYDQARGNQYRTIRQELEELWKKFNEES
jgi:hypothetical protein